MCIYTHTELFRELFSHTPRSDIYSLCMYTYVLTHETLFFGNR